MPDVTEEKCDPLRGSILRNAFGIHKPPLYRMYVSVTSWHSTLAPKARITPANMVGFHEKCGPQREEGAALLRESLNSSRQQGTCQSWKVRSVTVRRALRAKNKVLRNAQTL